MKTTKEIKSSDIHKIIAAVLEKVEVLFPDANVKVDGELCDATSHENMAILALTVTECISYRDVVTLAQKLGGDFDIKLTSKSKTFFYMIIEGSVDDFVALLKNPKAVPPLAQQRNNLQSDFHLNNNK